MGGLTPTLGNRCDLVGIVRRQARGSTTYRAPAWGPGARARRRGRPSLPYGLRRPASETSAEMVRRRVVLTSAGGSQ
jgi:hypothetical protein